MKGELVVRPYSPTSSNDDVGHFDLVIKVPMRPPAAPKSDRQG